MSSSQTINNSRGTAAERQAARAKALGHPLRFRILAALAYREASPAELAEELDVDLQKIAYHFRYLAGALPHSPEPLIELVGTDQRRGGTQHFYRRIERSRVDMEAAETLPQAVREDMSVTAVEAIISDLLGALQAGTLDSHPQRSLMEIRGMVDDKGMHQLAEAVEAHVDVVEAILAESLCRLAESSEAPIPIASGTLVFPVRETPSPDTGALNELHRSD